MEKYKNVIEFDNSGSGLELHYDWINDFDIEIELFDIDSIDKTKGNGKFRMSYDSVEEIERDYDLDLGFFIIYKNGIVVRYKIKPDGFDYIVEEF